MFENELPTSSLPKVMVLQHLVTRRHFRSRDKHGGHNIRSVIAENLMIHTNCMALSFIEPELWAIEDLHCGNRILDFLGVITDRIFTLREYVFLAFFAPVTLTLIR